MLKMHYVYGIRHNGTKRIYIGCATSEKRIRSHMNALKRGNHQNQKMQDDCDKYGFDFTAYVLEVFPATGNTYTCRENYWIRYFNSDLPEYGYNDSKWFSKFKLEHFPVFDEETVRGMLTDAKTY